MALGLVYGSERIDEFEGLYEGLPTVRDFCRRFEKEVGGITCRKILKSNFADLVSTDEPFKIEKERNINEMQRCEDMLKKSVHIAAEMLSNQAEFTNPARSLRAVF